ncbi:hydroxyacid dehydrogenase [Chloroflexi bacterium TSY]|nr:hydroxyacid dehydrogenase [Chloroflexi bacterium TSY]
MTLPKVWSEPNLHPEAAARLDGIADLILNGKLDTLPGAEVALIGGSNVSTEFIEIAGPPLKLVARHGAGFNTLDVPTLTTHGVLATNAPTGPTEPTAEHTVALLLALAKRIVKGHIELTTNQPYTREGLRGTETMDQTLGIIGVGRIGSRVAEICALGLKMHVLAYDPYLTDSSGLPDGVEVVADLAELLRAADFVTIHTPLMPETHHFFGDREFSLMRPNTYFINASRGPVVDEAALVRALESGHLAGAGLDVFDPEPPEPDNPLLQMSNVVLTPHIAANTRYVAYGQYSDRSDACGTEWRKAPIFVGSKCVARAGGLDTPFHN